MLELLKTYQLNIMLGLSSISFAVGFFALMTKSLARKRKAAITYLEFSSGILLFSDRLAYIHHGNTSTAGYYLVRIANFLVFFMTISVIHSFNLYLTDLCKNEIGLKKIPLRLKLVEIISAFGWVMVIISQFTGLYYSFTPNNEYERGPGFLICYAIPFIALFIQLSVVFQYVRRLSPYISIPMLLFTILPILASIAQIFIYGISFTNMTITGTGVVLYIFAIMEMNEIFEKAQAKALDDANRKNRSTQRSFEQFIETVVKALDSKDRYSRGHSLRVAEYSRNIADALGLSEKECVEVYNSAALHEIGRLGIRDSLVVKGARRTDAEEEMMRNCPQIGADILSEVDDLPYLKVAALYHRERFDGKGYPGGLKGEEIPLIGRIVSVANAYDEMTSFTASRQPLAQGKVREAFVNGAGKEFDPVIAGIMVDMIDHDTDYNMRESDEDTADEADKNNISVVKRMHFEGYKEIVTDGIKLIGEFLSIRFEARSDEGYDGNNSIPAIILFDSFDRCVHRNERDIRNLHYFEYGEIWMDGHTVCTGARDIKTKVTQKEPKEESGKPEWIQYDIEAVCIGDHARVMINNKYMSADVIMALPDATRYVFLGITGEHCGIKNVSIKSTPVTEDMFIPRIAPEVNYFTRKDGDIPNVEVDGYRENASAGVPIFDGMRLFFHTKGLPVANLVHHCAYIVIYSSDDGAVRGKNYSEFACIRLDGDDSTIDGKGENRLKVVRDSDFAGWDDWKEQIQKGLDVEVEFSRKRNNISFKTDNAGIGIDFSCALPKDITNVYVALTGNLVTIVNIRVR